MSLFKKHPKKIIALIILVVAIGYSYSWTFTPHGRLDYRAAVSLHTLSFTYKDFKPDPTQDFVMPLPVNLLYGLSDAMPHEKVAETKDLQIPGQDHVIPA